MTLSSAKKQILLIRNIIPIWFALAFFGAIDKYKVILFLLILISIGMFIKYGMCSRLYNSLLLDFSIFWLSSNILFMALIYMSLLNIISAEIVIGIILIFTIFVFGIVQFKSTE